jgi:DNA-binding IclR family transcriptional regulator
MPAYGIESVDHALRLAVLLQQEGPFGVTEAAERIGVARSTAHRLLAMLVYRDFASQDPDRRYAAGPVLHGPGGTETVAQLRTMALPHLRALVERTNETANLMVPTGTQMKFVVTVECDQALRVGDREGRLLPVHLASGGLALIARLTPEEIDLRYPMDEKSEIDIQTFRKALRQTRRQGFAINNQATETGVTAIGHAIDAPTRPAFAAVSIAMPTARYRRDQLPTLAAALRDTSHRIEQDLRAEADIWKPTDS